MKKNYLLIFLLLFSGVMKGQVAASVSLWKDGVIGAIWNKATETVAYGRADGNGVYKIYLSDSLGNNETALTYSSWQSDRHQWAEEWDPTGQYLICYVEKNDYIYEADHTRISGDAIPGYGAYMDIWLLKRDGSEAWQLTNFPNDYSNGVIHGAISNDGTKFAWSERTLPPDLWNFNITAGAYVFKVADLVYSPTPTLSNIQTYIPGNVDASGEVESFSADNSKIAIYSAFESHSIVATPIYTIDLTTSQVNKMTVESFCQCPTYTPSGNQLVYMTGKDCDIFPWQFQGADWWVMDADSTNKTRLTYMNVTGNPQCVDQYRLAGSLSFMSEKSFLGGVMTQSAGLSGYTAKVNFSNIVTEVTAKKEISFECLLYPNPATNIVTITLYDELSDLNVHVLDLNGKEVLPMQTQLQLDISKLQAGSYIVELFAKGRTTSRKLFVKTL